MLVTALGLITVVTAGTPVAITASAALRANHLLIQPAIANTGVIYVKTPGGVIIRQLPPMGTSGIVNCFEIGADDNCDLLQLRQYLIDAAVSGEGSFVSIWTT
jgi:hypothetical protein